MLNRLYAAFHQKFQLVITVALLAVPLYIQFPDGVKRRSQFFMPGQHDHEYLPVKFPQPCHHFIPTDRTHNKVQQKDVIMPDLKLLQRPQRIGLGLYFIAHRPEICPQRIQYILIIIQDHQCISIFLFSSFVFAHLIYPLLRNLLAFHWYRGIERSTAFLIILKPHLATELSSDNLLRTVQS